LAARKTPPKGGLRYLLAELADGHWTLCQSLGQGSALAAEILGLAGRQAIAEAIAAASEQRAQVIGLALVLAAYEEHTSTESWRMPKDSDRRYLAALAGWGYQPSDVEKLVTEPRAD
jgi:ParB family chromosome partitioning protein